MRIPGALAEALTWTRHMVGVTRRDPALNRAAELLRGAVALEPGGPSALFGRRGLVPVYPRLRALDVLDFAERTLWSHTAFAEAAPRRRLIADAAHLDQIQDGAYDAVLCSHVIEHLANPLGALREWARVVRSGGHLLLIVPHRDGTFDHRRPVTTLAHLRRDAEQGTSEDDLTHLPEVLALHDLDRDPGAPSRAEFERRCRENHALRAMHHHVFTSHSTVELCRAAGLDVLQLRALPPYNIVCLCGVGHSGSAPMSESELAQILSFSPFLSDRGNSEPCKVTPANG